MIVAYPGHTQLLLKSTDTVLSNSLGVVNECAAW